MDERKNGELMDEWNLNAIMVEGTDEIMDGWMEAECTFKGANGPIENVV